MSKKETIKYGSEKLSIVLYCIVRRSSCDGMIEEFLLITKQGYSTFPPTKFRPGEDLYSALIRPMVEDLGLPERSFFPEKEISPIPNAGKSIRYPGLTKKWLLCPVDISLTHQGKIRLKTLTERKGRGTKKLQATWWTLDTILKEAKEPNVLKIAKYLQANQDKLLKELHSSPSMEALASHWATMNSGGVRFACKDEIERILDAGSRAFNLRVADPYLSYQKQGLGFTWSFFTSKDKQDVHVHGLPAVEIYGVLEGRLQIWYKSMNSRGVRTWHCRTLKAGDWAEIEPLYCHFACWLDPQGLGTVVKAAGSGELAGLGKLGVAGKTTCVWKDVGGQEQHCSNYGNCAFHPNMKMLMDEYRKDFGERDYKKITTIAEEGEEIK